MQVDAGDVLKHFNPVLRLMSESEAIGGEDENEIEEERGYIADLLDEANIKYDRDGDDFIVRGEQVPDACLALDLMPQQCELHGGEALVQLWDTLGFTAATLTLEINDTSIGYMVIKMVGE